MDQHDAVTRYNELMINTIKHASGGLRQRKKDKTKAAIRQSAFRLFQEKGYAATSVEQIAELAEVSISTFFRYFPKKEDVVVADNFDSLVIDNLKALPTDLPTLQALRTALRKTYQSKDQEEPGYARLRHELMAGVPELRARMLDESSKAIGLLTQVIAERTGKQAEDIAVQALAGAILGISMMALFAASSGTRTDYLTHFDEGLAQLEVGFPL